MGKYHIDGELFKGEEEVLLMDEFDSDATIDSILYGAKLAFDKGTADKVVIYISKDGDLLEILTKSAAEFDVKETYTQIEEIKEEYAGR